jgi:hypothetical protein
MSETKLPPSASRSGTNAYYFGSCSVVGHSPAYCVCLNKIEKVKTRAPDAPSGCAEAISHGRCMADSMRQSEELQGQALYFIARETIATGLAKIPAWSVETPEMCKHNPHVTPAAPARAATVIAANTGGSYADAINAAVKELSAAPTPTPAPAPIAAAIAAKPAAPRPPMNPGETPMQYARRLAATN